MASQLHLCYLRMLLVYHIKPRVICVSIQVGTLDVLVSLTDQLQKLDPFVEGLVTLMYNHFKFLNTCMQLS